ncbi:ankyrin repeat-containing domain protein, partial [Tuber indicum]
MLLEHGFDLLSHRDQYGDTALHLAAKFGDIESMRLMLDRGIPVDWHGPRNSPALNHAIEAGKLEAIELLLQRGADPNSAPIIPLDLAVEYGRIPVIDLLVKHGANVHCRNNLGDTVLHWAVQSAQVGVLDYFLGKPELGLDVNVQNRHLITPLHRACFMDPAPNWEIVDLLLQQKNIRVDLQDDYGRTALINASETGSIRLIEALIGKGADVNICDHQGNSAL